MINLDGPWVQGFAFDIYTTSSQCVGYNPWGYPLFDNRYSPMGQLVKDFKYSQQISKLSNILELLKQSTEFNSYMNRIDIILPVVPSNKARLFQPVYLLAQALADIYKKQLIIDAISSTNTEQIKGIDTSEKYVRVKSSLAIRKDRIDSRSNILILDDVFDSGSTLQAYTDALKENGYSNVFLFTLTKTRISD